MWSSLQKPSHLSDTQGMLSNSISEREGRAGQPCRSWHLPFSSQKPELDSKATMEIITRSLFMVKENAYTCLDLRKWAAGGGGVLLKFCVWRDQHPCFLMTCMCGFIRSSYHLLSTCSVTMLWLYKDKYSKALLPR